MKSDLGHPTSDIKKLSPLTFAEQVELLLMSFAEIAQKKPEWINLLNQVYSKIFGETIQQGCGNCYTKAYYRIRKYIYLNQSIENQLTMPESPRKYLLKPDRSLQTTFGGDTLTNDNLTDEAAEKLLKEHPSLLKHFDRYPDLEEPAIKKKSVAKTDPPKAEDLSQLPVQTNSAITE